MSPPEVWGPPIWTLFHTLIEKINEKYHHIIYQQLFNIIKQICNYLPCPECSTDAVVFLSKIKIQTLNTKVGFKNMMYLFHNYVNKKKHKPLFNYANINIYKGRNLVHVIKNFLNVYNTKGNMKLLTQSFQRQMVINNFRKWIADNFFFFFENPQPRPTPAYKNEENQEIILKQNDEPILQNEENQEIILKQNDELILQNEENQEIILKQNDELILQNEENQELLLEENEENQEIILEKNQELILEQNEEHVLQSNDEEQVLEENLF
jgi:hypothetical protein